MDAPPFPGAVIEAARDAAKAHLRIAGDAEDALIQGLAAAALGLCEAFAGQALIAREFTDVLGVSRKWEALPAVPVSAIGAVEGLPADGPAFALPAEAYAIDIDAAQTGWVRVTAPGAAGRVRVSYSAGMAAAWDELPAPLAQGVVVLVAHLFGGREDDAAPPAAVSALWRPWRRLRLSAERAA